MYSTFAFVVVCAAAFLGVAFYYSPLQNANAIEYNKLVSIDDAPYHCKFISTRDSRLDLKLPLNTEQIATIPSNGIVFSLSYSNETTATIHILSTDGVPLRKSEAETTEASQIVIGTNFTDVVAFKYVPSLSALFVLERNDALYAINVSVSLSRVKKVANQNLSDGSDSGSGRFRYVLRIGSNWQRVVSGHWTGFTVSNSGKTVFLLDDGMSEYESILNAESLQSRKQRNDARFALGLMEVNANGSLWLFNRATSRLTKIVSGFALPHDISLAGNNEEYLLITETAAAQIRRYWLKGPAQGRSDIIAHFPGLPTSLVSTAIQRKSKTSKSVPNTRFLIGLPIMRDVSFDFFATSLWLKKLLAWLPLRFWVPLFTSSKTTAIVMLDVNDSGSQVEQCFHHSPESDNSEPAMVLSQATVSRIHRHKESVPIALFTETSNNNNNKRSLLRNLQS